MQFLWAGANLKYEGIQDIINQIGLTEEEKVEGLSPTEIRDEWKRLASFMSGQK